MRAFHVIPSIIVCVSAVACLLVAEWADSAIAKAAAKMSAATAFLAMALACGALESSFGLTLLGGLVLCWIGDACLLSRGQSTGFLIGIGAFLFGHIAYAIAFYQLGLDPIGLMLGGMVVAVLAAVLFRWLVPRVPEDFSIPVMSYLGVISLMVVTSIGAVAAGAPVILFVGAVVFAISDIFVARERFVRTGFVNSAVGLPAYFGAQLLIAYSAGVGLTTWAG
jgi:uncharacterized membrane protein YhhN